MQDNKIFQNSYYKIKQRVIEITLKFQLRILRTKMNKNQSMSMWKKNDNIYCEKP